MTQGHFVKWSKGGLNSEFFFSLTGCLAKVKESIRPNYLSTVRGEGRKNGFMPFPRVLESETETASSII